MQQGGREPRVRSVGWPWSGRSLPPSFFFSATPTSGDGHCGTAHFASKEQETERFERSFAALNGEKKKKKKKKGGVAS